MKENFIKAILYFYPIKTYWNKIYKIIDFKEKEIGYYPLSLKKRIDQGHYSNFDKIGIPRILDMNKKLIYSYTTMCSYALALWEKYLDSGESSISV